MSIVSCIPAGVYLLLFPYLIRCSITALFHKLKKEITCSYLTAALLFFAAAQGLFLVTVSIGRGLAFYRLALLLLFALLLVLSIGGFWLDQTLRSREKEQAAAFLQGLQRDKRRAAIPAVCFCICLVAMLLAKTPFESDMYDTAERMKTIMESGGFFGIDPVTGQLSAGISLRERLMGLPAFYAATASMLHVPVLSFLRVAIPVFLLVLVCLLLHRLSEITNKLGAGCGALCFGFLLALLCAGSAYRNPFYDLLHLPFEGRCFLAIWLLPFGLLLLWEQKKAAGRIGTLVLILLSSVFFSGAAEGALIVSLGMILWSVALWISRYIS
ncbi:MAG: hypothetical protein K6E18_04035 [Lachnospiraceae bacterium]|nr:hypothetical protein [Lachnospiraceae bacterium]